jgi:hypothetical protein
MMFIISLSVNKETLSRTAIPNECRPQTGKGWAKESSKNKFQV